MNHIYVALFTSGWAYPEYPDFRHCCGIARDSLVGLRVVVLLPCSVLSRRFGRGLAELMGPLIWYCPETIH